MGNAFSERVREPLYIGSVRLDNRLAQAPMAGISGRAFRLQARRFGAALSATEMISSYGIHYGNRRTMDLLDLGPGEHPVSVQLFGNRPGIMAEAAAAAERAGADLIDVNMGCPVRKVLKTGAGAALMKDEGLAAEIVAEMAAAVSVPVTAKIRSGFSGVTALSLGRRLQAAGAAAVGIHPRTAEQAWKGKADHGVTAALADELGIPVMASGDVEGPDDVRLILDGLGAAAVMVGRAALGNPWLFSDLLAGRAPRRRPLDEVLDEMERFYGDAVEEMGEERAASYMRKFYGWYLRPFRPSPDLRAALLKAEGIDPALKLVRAGIPKG